MDHQAIYMRWILAIKERDPPDGKTEQHHVIPRSIGGANEQGNIVVVTVREHYFAHILLARIINNEKTWAALYSLINTRKELQHKKGTNIYKRAALTFSEGNPMKQPQFEGRKNPSHQRIRHNQPTLNEVVELLRPTKIMTPSKCALQMVRYTTGKSCSKFIVEDALKILGRFDSDTK